MQSVIQQDFPLPQGSQAGLTIRTIQGGNPVAASPSLFMVSDVKPL
jgi:hypothetical protein